MRRISVLAIVLASVALVGVVVAQQPAGPQMFYVHQQVVKPSMLAEQEQGARAFIAGLKEHGIAFHFNTVSTTEFDYYYVLPIRRFADIDTLNGALMALAGKMGEARFDALIRGTTAAVDHTVEWVVIQRDDLSYVPASPRLTSDQVKYVRYDFVYVRPGQEKAAENLSKEWAALYRSKNVTDGYTTYQAAMGPDLPVFVYSMVGTSPADIEAHVARTEQALGEEGRALSKKTLPIVRRFEFKTGQLRPELSYPAPAPSS